MLAPSINRMLIYVCRRLYAVRGRSSLSNRRFSSSVMVLKSSFCHWGKMRSVGSGVRHSSPRTSELSDTSLGARTPSTRLGRPASKSLKWTHCIGHTLAISESPFSAHFNLKNCLAQTLVVNALDITELKAPCLIRPQSGIAREEDIIMKLLRLPFETPFLRL